VKRIPNLCENVFIVDCELSHERYGALSYRIFQASTDCVPRPFGVLRLKISGGAKNNIGFQFFSHQVINIHLFTSHEQIIIFVLRIKILTTIMT